MNTQTEMSVGGIVLCGGHSTRMGRPKFSLPFGDEVLLQRVCRILSEVVSPIVVVAAADQELPSLPENVRVVRDEYDSLGPLAGIATGLDALRKDADAAFVTSCDAPLLRSEFVRRLIELL
ncbi:MAG: molybdenum cofactor guanylyltransferase, partial [Rhodopirellula sp.]|nr:molybdenum cofactor guanylyltransferase [Rhodopirellula sp.]